MKIRSKFFAVIILPCALSIVHPSRSMAAISDEDFQKLAAQVQQLSTKVQTLEQTHEQDQHTINQLKQQVVKTKETANDAAQKADAATQKLQQPVDPMLNIGNAATHNVVLTGDAEIQFGRTSKQHSGFTMADFAPIFLYRANDNILFEVGFDITMQNGSVSLLNGRNGNLGAGTSVGLSFAQIDYMVNDYVTVMAGDMILPLGTYVERGAGWLNKLPDDPLARGVLPDSGVGIQLRGAVPVGDSGKSITYSLYGVNGPSSVDGSGNSFYTDSLSNVLTPNLDLGGNVGVDSNGNSNFNVHNHPSGGGRLGFFLPFHPHYDVEFGVSGQTGEWSDSGNQWSAAVLDASVHISPYFELKGEYINTWVDTTDIGTYKPKGWWVQGAYKLAGLGLEMPYISNVELVSRYDVVNDGLGTRVSRATAGVVYYFTNTLQMEGAYEWLHSRGPNPQPDSAFVLQLSYGF